MAKFIKLITILFFVFLVSCGEKEDNKEPSFIIKGKTKTEAVVAAKSQNILPSKKIDLDNKGIGPIEQVQLKSEIDQTLVIHGSDLYKNKCASCHRTNKKFIGPSSAGIIYRRSPEYIMNKMLNPSEMIRKDHLTKELLKEFDFAIMPNQGLSEYDARAILEYFRTLD